MTAHAGFCRDCLADVAEGAARCAACGSPRLVRHARARRALDRPCRLRRLLRHDREARRSLARRQAGDHRRRQARRRLDRLLHRAHLRRALGDADVQGAASSARMRRSSRPTWRNMSRVGREVRAADARADAAGRAALDRRGVHGPVRHRAAARHERRRSALARFARRVERDIGITVSIGLSANKFLAKIASDLDKPRGFAVLGRERGAWLPGAAAGRVHLGRRQGDAGAARSATATAPSPTCSSADETDLMRRYGVEGRRLCAARPRHRRPRASNPERETKSVSAETTFDQRHRRLQAAGEDALVARRAGLGAAEGERHCGRDRHAEAEDRGLPPPHPRPLARRADAAGDAHLRGRARPAAPRDRRHEIPPDRHRRLQPHRGRGRRRRPGEPAVDARRQGRARDRQGAREIRQGRDDQGPGVRRRGRGGCG